MRRTARNTTTPLLLVFARSHGQFNSTTNDAKLAAHLSLGRIVSSLEFVQFVAREDNFGVLIHDPESGRTAAVDAPDAGKIQDALTARGWHLDTILITHHHFDHVEGVEALCARYQCTVLGPQSEADKIPHLSRSLADGEHFELFGHPVNVIETPGHTSGHIVYHLPNAGVLFAGDTLFSLGCGKLFEGTAAQMWASLQKIMALPTDTTIYVGHDYTVENGEYALQWEPENNALIARMDAARALQANGEPTLPTTLQQELDTNPFLRPASPELRATLNMQSDTDLDVFTRVRELRG